MALSDILDKLFNAKDSKDLKDIANLTKEEIEELGSRFIDALDDKSDEVLNRLNEEKPEFIRKVKEQFKNLKENPEEESHSGQDEGINFHTQSADSDSTVENQEIDEIDMALKKADSEINSADEIMNKMNNLEAIKELNLIPEDFIAKARKYADSSLKQGASQEENSLSSKKAGDSTAGLNKAQFTDRDRDGDGDSRIDDADIEEE